MRIGESISRDELSAAEKLAGAAGNEPGHGNRRENGGRASLRILLQIIFQERPYALRIEKSRTQIRSTEWKEENKNRGELQYIPGGR